MTKSDYVKARERLDAQRISLEASLQKVIETIKALDLVWTQLFNGELVEAGPEPTGSNFFTGKLVEMAVSRLHGQFGAREVAASILEMYPHLADKLNASTISGRLSKMAEERQIRVVDVGQGSRGTTYRRIQ